MKPKSKKISLYDLLDRADFEEGKDIAEHAGEIMGGVWQKLFRWDEVNEDDDLINLYEKRKPKDMLRMAYVILHEYPYGHITLDLTVTWLNLRGYYKLMKYIVNSKSCPKCVYHNWDSVLSEAIKRYRNL